MTMPMVQPCDPIARLDRSALSDQREMITSPTVLALA